MNFDTPAQLASWYYDHLYVHVGQVRAKGLVCKHYVEERGPWWEEFRNIAANMRFTLKGGRTLLRLIRDLMDKQRWPYQAREFPPEPVYANSVALAAALCDECKNRYARQDEDYYYRMPVDKAFNALYWDFIRDHRIALGFMRRLEEVVERNGWIGTTPLDTLEFQINDVQSRIRWGWRCTEASYLGALTTHGINHDRDTLEMKAKRPVLFRPVDMVPEFMLCDECQHEIIEDI